MVALFLMTIDSQEDKDLFTVLYQKHRNFMYYIANRILNDPSASENIVHDACIRIIENLDKFKSLDSNKTKGLIYLIVDGYAKNEYNRRKRFRSYDDAIEDSQSYNPVLDEQIVEQERYDELKLAINKLDSIYSNTLLLRYEFHYSTKEIAEITGVSEDTVRQRLHRAKMKLKEVFMKAGRSI